MDTFNVQMINTAKFQQCSNDNKTTGYYSYYSKPHVQFRILPEIYHWSHCQRTSLKAALIQWTNTGVTVTPLLSDYLSSLIDLRSTVVVAAIVLHIRLIDKFHTWNLYRFLPSTPPTHNNFLVGSCDHMTSFSSNHGSKFAAPALLLSHWLVLALSTNSRGAVAYAFKVCGNSVSS